ncbi:kinase domain-containing protein, partial [Naegleria gruberi]
MVENNRPIVNEDGIKTSSEAKLTQFNHSSHHQRLHQNINKGLGEEQQYKFPSSITPVPLANIHANASATNLLLTSSTFFNSSSESLGGRTISRNSSNTLKSLLENVLPPFFTPCVPPHASFNYYSEHYWGEHALSLTSFSPILHYEKKSSLTIICRYTPQQTRNSSRRERPSSQKELIENEIYCLKVSLDKPSIPKLERDAEISRFLTNEFSQVLDPTQQVIVRTKAYLSDYFILVREFIDCVSLRLFIDRSKTYNARVEPITDHENFETLTNDTVTLLNEEQRVKENITILESNLTLAISICMSVAQLHHSRVCHADIKPENIIVDGPKCNIRLIDFGKSTFLPLEHPFLYTDKIIGSRMYCAPEATGKIPKPIGFHTDIYSLGFVLFELFSKEHPFTKFRAVDFVFQHLTQQPESLFQNLARRSFISANEGNLFTAATRAISRLITKAIQKSIEKRYLSIFGLKRDLLYIQNAIQLEDMEALENFQAGMNDVQTTLSIPYGVYGREEIFEKLKLKLENMMESSESMIVLLGGYSGIGKSSIVKEFRTRSKTAIQFFEAKYDQHMNIPYYAIISICKQIIGDVLGESESVIKDFRFQFGTLINSDQLEMLSDAIPDMSYLFTTNLAKKHTSPSMGDQNGERMKLFSQGIIHLFSCYTHLKKKRLCIFLDDLQWTDFDSMKLLKEILGTTGSCDTVPLLIIGAYRNNEVGKDHPLFYFLENLKLKVNIEEIQVVELTQDQSNMIVSESLNRAETEELTKILFPRTNGNPFFLKQLLAGLFKDGAIYFDTQTDTITWDKKKIENAEYISENVIDYLLGHLEKLPKQTQDILAFASCFGNKFSNKDMLHLLNQQQEDKIDLMQLKERLNYAVKEGWISNINSGHLRFNHDRLQQAAYESLPLNERLRIHYNYG